MEFTMSEFSKYGSVQELLSTDCNVSSIYTLVANTVKSCAMWTKAETRPILHIIINCNKNSICRAQSEL